MSELFDAIADNLDAATTAGHLPRVETVRQDIKTRNNQDSTAFIRVIRTRLIALGYLGDKLKNISQEQVDVAFTRAVSKFQRDTGLTKDAWLGPVSWKKLQQLASFDDDQDPALWNLEPTNPAVLRALYLRLYTFGLMQWKRDKLKTTTKVTVDNPVLRNSLGKFLIICKELGLIEETVPSEITSQTLALVFSQDELIAAINNTAGFYSDPENADFLTAVARVELWMLGYDIAVGYPGISGDRKLSKVVRDFWRDNQESPLRPARKEHRESVTNALFQQLLHFQQTDCSDNESNDANSETHLLEQIDQLSDENQQSLQQEVQSVTSSIWDGVKRLFGWLRSMARKIVGNAINFIKNLARLIARQSREAFRLVKTSISILHQGIVYAKNSTFPRGGKDSMIISRQRDFDHSMIISDVGLPSQLNSTLGEYQRFASTFNTACKIMGHLLGIFTTLLRSVGSGILGWFVLLRSLAHLGAHLKQISLELNELENAYMVPADTLFAV